MIEQRYTQGAAVLIAGGPSLTREQVEACRPLYERGLLAVFGCNDAYRICDFLDLLYAADYLWIEHHDANVPAYLAGRCYTSKDKRTDAFPHWHQIKTMPDGYGFNPDRARLNSGNHSGYQLIQIAYLSGVTTMMLIGYDGTSGGDHWFGKHPTRNMQMEGNYEKWNVGHRTLARQCVDLGLTIVNCSPGSAIDAYPRLDLADALASLETKQ